ncbi:MAG: hypothetical protein ACKVY0_09085 [Prosthecobacter sp.]|uniref:hypothetical protein n=1 Tax=Prosthecobacter sp. TaxID=1965333 RepID=UPI0038FFE62C
MNTRAANGAINITGSGPANSYDLFSNVGDNTGIANSVDRIRRFGPLDNSLGGTLVLSNPNSLSGFASTNQWKLFDWATLGSITTDFALDYSSLSLGPSLAGSFDRTSGIFSIISIPDPSRALLLMLGVSGLMLPRRRA